jgi:hypothetical protein
VSECVCERESGVNLSGDMLMPIYEVLSHSCT